MRFVDCSCMDHGPSALEEMKLCREASEQGYPHVLAPQCTQQVHVWKSKHVDVH